MIIKRTTPQNIDSVIIPEKFNTTKVDASDAGKFSKYLEHIMSIDFSKQTEQDKSNIVNSLSHIVGCDSIVRYITNDSDLLRKYSKYKSKHKSKYGVNSFLTTYARDIVNTLDKEGLDDYSGDSIIGIYPCGKYVVVNTVTGEYTVLSSSTTTTTEWVKKEFNCSKSTAKDMVKNSIRLKTVSNPNEGAYYLEHGVGCINTVEPGNVILKHKDDIVNYDEKVDAFKQLVMNIAPNKDERDHLMRYVSSLTKNHFNKQWIKPNFAAVIVGSKGVGKDVFINIVQKVIGSYANTSIHQMLEKFNTAQVDNKIINIAEVMSTSLTEQEKISNSIKTIITESEPTIERKYKEATKEKAISAYFITSNQENSLFKITPSDRRFLCVRTSETPLPKLMSSETIDTLVTDSFEAIAHFLYNFNTEDYVLKGLNAPSTITKTDITIRTLNPVNGVILSIIKGDKDTAKLVARIKTGVDNSKLVDKQKSSAELLDLLAMGGELQAYQLLEIVQKTNTRLSEVEVMSGLQDLEDYRNRLLITKTSVKIKKV